MVAESSLTVAVTLLQLSSHAVILTRAHLQCANLSVLALCAVCRFSRGTPVGAALHLEFQTKCMSALSVTIRTRIPLSEFLALLRDGAVTDTPACLVGQPQCLQIGGRRGPVCIRCNKNSKNSYC